MFCNFEWLQTKEHSISYGEVYGQNKWDQHNHHMHPHMKCVHFFFCEICYCLIQGSLSRQRRGEMNREM